jgi:hypothetical protein
MGYPRMQVERRQVQVRPRKVSRTKRRGVHDIGEVIRDESLFVLMVKDPASVVAEMLYEVLPSSVVGPKVKETGVGIAFTDVVDSSTLFFLRFFNSQPTGYVFLKLGAEVELSTRELPDVLCFVETHDYLLGHEQFLSSVREKGSAPLPERHRCGEELVS